MQAGDRFSRDMKRYVIEGKYLDTNQALWALRKCGFTIEDAHDYLALLLKDAWKVKGK